MAKKTSETTTIISRPINLKHIVIELVSKSPLIIHNWSEKAKRQMLEAQQGKKAIKQLRNPYEDLIESLYWIKGKPTEMSESAFNQAIKDGAEFGVKASSFKLAMASAAYRNKIAKDKVTLMGSLFIKANENDLLKINGVPEMQEDMVVIGNGSADLRYRGVFKQWSILLQIQFNADIIDTEQIVNLLNLAGFCCGVGDWRVEKKGQYGMFEVKKVAQNIG